MDKVISQAQGRQGPLFRNRRKWELWTLCPGIFIFQYHSARFRNEAEARLT
jgi:hypothetical protein